jgi:hypothetical protein
MRRIAILGVLLLFVAGYGITGGAAAQKEGGEELCFPVGDFLIEAPEGVEARRSPVPFSHSRHFDYSCKTCHHTWAGEANIPGCTASGCHDLTRAPEESKGGTDTELAIGHFKAAFHQLCIGCHRDIRQQNIALERKPSLDGRGFTIRRAGPTGCIGCHP